MLAKHTLHFVLTEALVRHVRDKVVASHHSTISDVVRHSLQGLMVRDDIAALTSDLRIMANQAPHG